MGAGGIRSAAATRQFERTSAAALPERAERTSTLRFQLLNNVASAIDACIDDVAAAELHETAALLAIARLDLLVHTTGITEEELQQLEVALEHARRGFKRVMPEVLRDRLAARTRKRRRLAAG